MVETPSFVPVHVVSALPGAEAMERVGGASCPGDALEGERSVEIVLPVDRHGIGALTQFRWRSSACCYDAGLEQVEIPSAIHLAFDHLQLVDLPLGLGVGPSGGNCGSDGDMIPGEPARERGQEAGCRTVEPSNAASCFRRIKA